MAKSKRVKKAFFTLGLVAALFFVNYLPASAGTDYQFWNMGIYSYQRSNQLRMRPKETPLQYSLVRVTSMTSVGKINASFTGGTYPISDSLTISNGVNTGKWLKLWNVNETSKSIPVALECTNYNFNSTNGSVSGWVDYE
ncbi:hypothetical protein [Clostridium estertheticum]|uniref:hypothetical protein n=1 Tax=Clostridium estertheticum TaxID=238834 RepID=UPI001C7CDF2A|nr:hypothetical protein [Clostridium estertheticum]MBX4272116.1 hypothetical protein [Clostridium estertheticum]WLC82488.1 hypothetical protein KTC98_24430 [Clostridium estertheticum]